jgi:SAM-dependent methyltransferase
MSQSKTAQLYDKHASTAFYDERYAHGYMDEWPPANKQKIREVLVSLNLSQEGAALDFGCGTGVLTELIGQTLPGWTVCGTDLSTVAIATAKQRYGKRQFFSPGDTDFAGKKFDLVVTHHVLEHVYEISEVLDEIVRYLQPEAAMLHILPCGNEGSFSHRLCRLRDDGINPQLGNRFFFEDEGHVRRMTTDELVNLCAKRGFALKRDYYTGQHYGAIEYFTQTEPELIPLMTNWSRAIDATSKLKIVWLAMYLRGLAACRSFTAKFENKRRQATKSAKDVLRLSLALVPYLIARAVNRRVTRKALEEWSTEKSHRNGDQMFLYFTRDG